VEARIELGGRASPSVSPKHVLDIANPTSGLGIDPKRHGGIPREGEADVFVVQGDREPLRIRQQGDQGQTLRQMSLQLRRCRANGFANWPVELLQINHPDRAAGRHGIHVLVPLLDFCDRQRATVSEDAGSPQPGCSGPRRPAARSSSHGRRGRRGRGFHHRSPAPVSVSSGSGSASLFPRPATSAPTCPVRGSPCAQRAQSSPHAGGSGLRARNLTASLARAARRDEDIEDLLIRLSSAGMRPPGARAACAPPAAWACRGWPPGPRGQRRLGARQLEPNRGANRTPNGRPQAETGPRRDLREGPRTPSRSRCRTWAVQGSHLRPWD
jgi:hypothetical protein